ncbi:PEP-CTERM sorting domain-containing protein [Chlorobaculum thiosulfatiphilum]|uniref:PEP-CTERM sorting domain-containing protein n=1 Tax=Chlorobaculum thiosulfatiphilum TaxID=115852 RepID=A0A5C4S9I5_CHLTI|nr:PEP-CTERM sorting domain-containing protein [Chlorobaculum thiosulfatiphilum]TNJ39827.1 PEP-CTERM sorting domain-containing protein [Chlorobaculum thiosulfatiphilum]
MKAKILLIGCLLATIAGTKANAAGVLAMNDITTTPTPTTTPYTTGMVSDPNIFASGISIGAGLSGTASVPGAYTANSWSTGASIGATDYLSFTIDANTGYEISFSSIDFNTQRSSNGPSSAVVEYSLDGGNTFQTIGSVIIINQAATAYSFDTSGISDIQNLEDPITFRLYGYNARNNGGTLSINNYSFNGSVEAVPEPQSLMLIGVGSLLMFGYLKRARKETDAMA